MMRRLLLAALFLLSAFPAFAVNPDEVLSDPALEARARALSAELRCMVCQNQSIDDSNAELARDLRLLWVACGTSDSLMQPNRDFIAWAHQKKLPVTPIETAGKHTWLVWRDNLLHFTPLLFRSQK